MSSCTITVTAVLAAIVLSMTSRSSRLPSVQLLCAASNFPTSAPPRTMPLFGELAPVKPGRETATSSSPTSSFEYTKDTEIAATAPARAEPLLVPNNSAVLLTVPTMTSSTESMETARAVELPETAMVSAGWLACGGRKPSRCLHRLRVSAGPHRQHALNLQTTACPHKRPVGS